MCVFGVLRAFIPTSLMLKTCEANTGWWKPVDHALPMHAHSLNALARAVRQPHNAGLEAYIAKLDDDSFSVGLPPRARSSNKIWR